MNKGRSTHTASLLTNGNVLVLSGIEEGDYASAEVYDSLRGMWNTTSDMLLERKFHAVSVLLNGKALVSGGQRRDSSAIRSAELYDPLTGFWNTTGAMNQGRYWHTSSVLATGKVLVAG
jgi:hypothetical protein